MSRPHLMRTSWLVEGVVPFRAIAGSVVLGAADCETLGGFGSSDNPCFFAGPVLLEAIHLLTSPSCQARKKIDGDGDTERKMNQLRRTLGKEKD